MKITKLWFLFLSRRKGKKRVKYRIAVASTDGKVVNQHFGRAEEFYIIEVDSSNPDTLRCIEKRSVSAFCEGGDHDDKRLEEAISGIADCGYVIVSRIGSRAERRVESHGIKAFELPGIIQESVREMINYLEIQNIINNFSHQHSELAIEKNTEKENSQDGDI